MIAKITGILAEVSEQAVLIERDGLGYEVLIPAYAVGELSAHRGSEVVLYTLEFLEGNASNGNLVPRLVGFLHTEDRAFFGRFIEVKGIGPRKALRALSEPVTRIAGWIGDREIDLLCTLPGIGKRGAEMIVAQLKGKIDDFAIGGAAAGGVAADKWTQAQRDALEIMLTWGDGRNEALRWLERAAQLHPDIKAADQWVRACYKIKAGSDV